MKGRDFARLVREASTQAKQGGRADDASADKLRRLALTLASGAAPRMLDDDIVKSLQSFAIARVKPAVAPGLYGRFEELLRSAVPLLTPGQLASTYLNFSLVEHTPSRQTKKAYLEAATSVSFYDAAHLKQLYFAASRMAHTALAAHVSGVILTGVREACDAALTNGGGGGGGDSGPKAGASAALDPACPDTLRSQVHALALHPRRALDAKQRALLRVWVETCWASLESLEDRIHALAGCERQGLRAVDADGADGDAAADGDAGDASGRRLSVPLRATVAELCGPRAGNYTPQEAVVMLEACQGSPTLADDATLLAALLAKAFSGVETPSLVRRALRPLAPLLARPERVRAVLDDAARRLDPSSAGGAGGAGRLPALLHRRLRAAAAPDSVSRPALLLTLRVLRRAGVLEASVPLDASVAAFLSAGPSTPALWIDTADTMCLLLRAQPPQAAAAAEGAEAAGEELPRSSAAGVSCSDVGRAAVRAALAAWEAADPPLSVVAGEKSGGDGPGSTGVTERQASLLMFSCGVFGVAPPPRVATAVVRELGGGGAAATAVPAPLRTLVHAFHKLQMPVWVAAVAATPRFSAAAASLSRQELLLVAEALVALPAARAAAGRNAGAASLPALPQAGVCGAALAVAEHAAAVVERKAGQKAAGGPAFEVAEAACFLRLFGGSGGGAAAAARALVLRDVWSSPVPSAAAEAGLVLARCLPRPADAGEAAQCARWFGAFSARAGVEAVALKQMLLLRGGGVGGGGNNDGSALSDEDLRRSNVLLPMMAAHLSPRLLPPACPRVAALEHLGELAAAAAATRQQPKAAAVGGGSPQQRRTRRPPSLLLRVAGALRRQTTGQRSWDALFVRSLGKNPLVWRHAWASASVAADDAGAKAGLLEPAFMVALRFATCAAAAEAEAGAADAPMLGTALARTLVPRLSAAAEAEAAPSPLVQGSGGVELLEVSLALLVHSTRDDGNGLEPLLLQLAERQGWWWSEAAGDAYWTWVRGVALCSRRRSSGGGGGSAGGDFLTRFAACVVAAASVDVGGAGSGDAAVALRAVSALVSVGAPPETFAQLREGWCDSGDSAAAAAAATCASAVKSVACNDETLLSLLGASTASVRVAHARLRRQGGAESKGAGLAADELLVEVFGAVVAGALAVTEQGLAQRPGCLVPVLESLDAAAIEAPAEALRQAVTASVEQAVRAAAPGTEPDTREAVLLRMLYKKHGGADKLTLHMLALCPTRKRLGKHGFRTLVATRQ